MLTYHRILPPDDPRLPLVQPGMVVTTTSFAMQMEHLRRHYDVLDQDAFIRGLAEGFAAERPSCLVTFDDGWRDNVEHALPVLKRLGIPGIVFLATDFVGTGRTFWSDRAASLLTLFHRSAAGLRSTPDGLPAYLAPGVVTGRSLDDFREDAIQRLKTTAEDERERILAQLAAELDEAPSGGRQVIDWDEVAELTRAGIVPGGHTKSHPILTEIDESRRAEEIAGSFAAIEENTGRAPRAFCYPNGNHTDAIVDTVKRAGYAAAFTCGSGSAGAGTDAYRVPRFSMHEDISNTEGAFACWITGVFA